MINKQKEIGKEIVPDLVEANLETALRIVSKAKRPLCPASVHRAKEMLKKIKRLSK